MRRVQPSELEMKILALLWERGPMTAREVLESLPDRKQRAYTSVLSVMQVMEKKGFLTRKREGLADRWRPLLKRDEVIGRFLGKIVSQLFAGRPSAVFQHLLRQDGVDPEEIQSIKKLLRDYEKSRGTEEES